MKIRLLLLLLLCIADSARAQPAPTRVILDRGTIHLHSAEAQAMANNVAAIVDVLIPGVPAGYSPYGIIMFEESPAFQKAHGRAPVTLSGPKLSGEPASTATGAIRIALPGVQSFSPQRFAYQLSHELARVKMGLKFDNSLTETLAMAVSLETLDKLGFSAYFNTELQREIKALPVTVRAQIAARNTPALKQYYQATTAKDFDHTDDRAGQFLGAMLLHSGRAVTFDYLLGVANMVICIAEPAGTATALCAPDVTALKGRGIPLENLGY